MFYLFIKKFTIFSFGIFFILYPLELLVDNGLAKTYFCNEWEVLVNSKINADLLIQGSSRAWVHISPKMIDSSLKLNSYNFGVDGYEFLMQYYRFKLYLKNNKKPKYIIQEVSAGTLAKRKDLYKIEQFLPYLSDKTIREAVSYYDGFSLFDFIIPCIKYRHGKNLGFNGVVYNIHPPLVDKYKGFKAQDKPWDESFEKFKNQNINGVYISVDKHTSDLFEEFIKYCHDNNILVILVYTPEFVEAQSLVKNRSDLIKYYQEISKKFGMYYLDYSKNEICNDVSNFYNSQHLNSTGVDKFNYVLVEDIKKIISSE